MPVKKDASGKRRVELEFIVPGSPEQIWAAMATGPGNSAWFTHTEIEEHVGGKVSFGFGEGVSSSGTVTTWEPPRRFGYEERGWSGEAPPLATEIVVTSRAGGKCVVRLVHSLFTSSDEWDDQMEGFEMGWPGFIEVLRVYLANFVGQKAAPIRAMGACAGDQAGAWKLLGEKLGLSGADVGDVRAAPAGAPPFAGAVEIVQQNAKVREIMLRLNQPGPGVALMGVHPYDGRTHASISMFLYGYDAPALAAKLEPQWRNWMAKTFPAEAG